MWTKNIHFQSEKGISGLSGNNFIHSFYDRDAYRLISDYSVQNDPENYLLGFWNCSTGQLIFGSSGMLHHDLAINKSIRSDLADNNGEWFGFTIFREEGLPGVQVMPYSSVTGDIIPEYLPGFKTSIALSLNHIFDCITMLEKDLQGSYHSQLLVSPN